MRVTHINPNQLLKTTNAVENHYSTPLIVDTLNEYISNCAELLFKYSGHFRAQMTCLISVYQTDHRKQLSSYSFEDNQIAFMTANVNFDYTPIRNLYIDRSVIFSQVNSFIKDLEYLVKLEIKSVKLKKRRIIKDFLLRKEFFELSIDPLVLLNAAKAWLELYIHFRNSIINNYRKFAFSKSMELSSRSQVYLDPNEVWMNFMLAVNRAIDKCDKKAGTLTSYIQQWFLNAKSSPEFRHEYGNVYYLPSSQKIRSNSQNMENNFAISITEENSTYILEIPETSEKLDFEAIKDYDEVFLKKLQSLRSIKLAYLSMGIPVILSEREKNRLHIRQSKLVQPA
jgi:hypothetical protein